MDGSAERGSHDRIETFGRCCVGARHRGLLQAVHECENRLPRPHKAGEAKAWLEAG
jgi:hypothetical protein